MRLLVEYLIPRNKYMERLKMCDITIKQSNTPVETPTPVHTEAHAHNAGAGLATNGATNDGNPGANSGADQNEVARTNLRRLSHDDLIYQLKLMHLPSFRAKQIEDWLWHYNIGSFDEMTNISKALRAQLAKQFYLYAPRAINKQVSQDGSRKYLLLLEDGISVECVGMPNGDKLSVCVSSQAGCAIGCIFCATGKAGLRRNLFADEIYQQALFIRDDFDGMRISNIVLMGQGEPLTNYTQALRALRLFNNPLGLGIGARHLTLSTCGIIPNIAKFAQEEEQFTLAVSLHSAVQKTRDHLMPGVKKFSLVNLYNMMQTYVQKTKRRPSYEYALIKGVNDTPEELQALCDFCRGTLCHVNLIQLNEIDDSPFKPTSEKRAQEFVRALNACGVEATIRVSRGQDIDAACGQLQQRRCPLNKQKRS